MLSPSNIPPLPIFFSFQLINPLFTYMLFIHSPPPPPSFLNIKLNSLFLIFSSFTHIIFPLLPTSLFHFHEIPSRLTWTIPLFPSTPSFTPFRLFPLPYTSSLFLPFSFPRLASFLFLFAFLPLLPAHFFVHQRVSPFSSPNPPTHHPLHNISTSLSR